LDSDFASVVFIFSPPFELGELLDVDPADLERDGVGDYPVGDDHVLYLSPR
jgi:hypothetical protein